MLNDVSHCCNVAGLLFAQDGDSKLESECRVSDQNVRLVQPSKVWRIASGQTLKTAAQPHLKEKVVLHQNHWGLTQNLILQCKNQSELTDLPFSNRTHWVGHDVQAGLCPYQQLQMAYGSLNMQSYQYMAQQGSTPTLIYLTAERWLIRVSFPEAKH